jgi:hypothetical protein
MDILLKYVGVWLLILWHMESVWVFCNKDDPQSYSLPVGNDHEPKPVSRELSALFSSGNDTVNLQNDTDEVKSKGDSYVNSTVDTKQNRAPENIVSTEGIGGMTLHSDTSHHVEGSTSSTNVSDMLSAYHSSFSAVEHDNRTSSTMARKGVTYKPNGVNYSLPTRSDQESKPITTDAFALFSSRNDTNKLQKETDHVKLKGDSFANSTVVTKQNRSEYIVSLEGGGGVTLHPDFSHLDAGLTPITELPGPLNSYHGSLLAVDHDNRTSSTVAQKGVMHKPKIVPRKGVDSNIEGTSTSMEGTDENVETNNNFLDKTCVCCLNNALKLGMKNGSNVDCSKCCDTMQNGETTSDPASSKSETVEPVNILHADSAGSPTSEDGTLENASDSVKQDKHNSGSPNNTSTVVTPLSKNKKPEFTLDAANDLPGSLNLPSQSSAHDKELNKTDYVIPVVLVILAVPLFIVLVVFFYKKSVEFWERRHYRQMDFLIDGIYND